MRGPYSTPITPLTGSLFHADPHLRREAIRIHGLTCKACKFNFEEEYGALGIEFIEVHHVIPFAETGQRETDPEKELTVLCSNCHRMVHQSRDTCLTVAELRAHIAAARTAADAVRQARDM